MMPCLQIARPARSRPPFASSRWCVAVVVLLRSGPRLRRRPAQATHYKCAEASSFSIPLGDSRGLPRAARTAKISDMGRSVVQGPPRIGEQGQRFHAAAIPLRGFSRSSGPGRYSSVGDCTGGEMPRFPHGDTSGRARWNIRKYAVMAPALDLDQLRDHVLVQEVPDAIEVERRRNR